MNRILQLIRIKSSLASDWSLDATEVETRRIQYGTNDILDAHTNRWLELLWDTIKDPMIWFLVITSALFAVLKNYNQAIILLLATIPLMGMDSFLHWRTQVSTRSLHNSLLTKIVVIRNGIENSILASEIVPGDLVVIPAGMFFPADGIIISGKNLQVNESALTGESFPIPKKELLQIPQGTAEATIDGEHWGFAGARLLTGRALLRVVYTGHETIYGEIVASALQSRQARTPLQKAIAKLVFSLIIVVAILCMFLIIVRYLQGFGIFDAILSAAILAVAALPDEFPVVFAFFLGVGVYRLARKKALVKRAVSVENIGRVTCICSDKTGTITTGHVELVERVPATGFTQQTLLMLGLAASSSNSGDPLDLAIMEEATKHQIKVGKYIIIFPFTEDRKRETSLIKLDSNQVIAATKGAPETILSLSTLTPSEKNFWLQRVNKFADTGYKVIACAQALLEEKNIDIEPTTNYQFAGLLVFIDPPRKEVAAAVKLCQESHIHVLMITGDHPKTAASIARTIGLGAGHPRVITGEEIENYLRTGAQNPFYNIDVIARATPSQKFDVVTSLQAAHEIVAVTGDGINDVPALKAGDVSIAMGEHGTQSAREVADIVLLDDNFESIVNALAEGRQLFKNMQSSFKYLLMIHIPFVLSAAIIPFMNYPLLYYPVHIVFIELIIHPTCLLVFQDLPPNKKPTPVVRTTDVHFFSCQEWISMITIGILTTLLVILSFIFVLNTSHNLMHARAYALAEIVFTSTAIVIGLTNLRSVISWVISVATIASSVLLIQIPFTAKFLSLTPLHLHDWIILVTSSLITVLLVKFFRLS